MPEPDVSGLKQCCVSSIVHSTSECILAHHSRSCMPVECAECGKVLEDRRGAHGHLRMGHNLSGAELEEAYERSLELEFEEPEEEEGAGGMVEERVREIAREEAEKVLRENAGLMDSVSAVDPSDSVPKAPDPPGAGESEEESTEDETTTEEPEAAGEESGDEEDDSLFIWDR